MPSDKLYFKCICKKEIELRETMATVCPDCKRTYWRYFDDVGNNYARLVWHPDDKQLEEEYDTKILSHKKDA